MDATAHIAGKPVRVSVSPAARRELERRGVPLVAEMELYFSCLIRKRVNFRDARPQEGSPVSERLAVSFRPVMTRHCGKDYEGDEPPLTDFPIANPAPYVPHWLDIDYRRGEWCGEFGYSAGV